jgi:hypothetical protein
LHRHNILAPQYGLEIRSEAGILGGDIDTIEVDEGVEGVNATQFFGGIIAVEYQIGDFTINGVVEYVELIGRKV